MASGEIDNSRSALQEPQADSGEKGLFSMPRGTAGRFFAMAGTYFAGVFNDNFFRQGALLLAVSAGKSAMQGQAMLIFTMPFILFGAWAGWFADRFSKRTVVITSKALELTAMCVAGVGVFTLNWPLMFITLAIMATQSALFSPAMNGTIPELFPPRHVLKANSIIRMVSTCAILGGIAAAGAVLDIKGTVFGKPTGRGALSAGLVLIAAAGFVTSLWVPRYPSADPKAKFPWSGPFYSLRLLWQIRRDRLLAVTVASKAFFWFSGSIQIMIINPLGKNQFGWSNTFTSLLIVVALAGVAIGAILSTKLSSFEKWHRPLGPACAVMGLSMAGVVLIPGLSESFRPAAMITAMGITGIAGGVFIIPMASFIQVHPPPGQRGKMIAVSNFTDFVAMLVSGPIYYGMAKAGLSPSNSFGIVGAAALVAGICLVFIFERTGND